MDTVRDDGQIYEILLKQLWAEWNHIKNGPHREAARCWDLLWVSPKAGKRESRRLLGDVILTQTDLEDGRCFPDDIAYGGHDLDDHKPIGETADIFGHSIPPLYGIPYRACYSRNIPNLLLAGRLISATHLAHSSTRIMRTGGAIGQAVGIAAALCARYQCTPRDVYQEHFTELKTMLLERDATILGQRRTERPGISRHKHRSKQQVRWNLTINVRVCGCRSLRVRVYCCGIGRRNCSRWHFICAITHQSSQSMHLTFYRSRREPKWKTIDEYDLVGRNDLRDGAFEVCGEVPFDLPPAHEGWISVNVPPHFHLTAKDAASDDDRLLIALEENRQVSWALARDRNMLAEMVEHSHHTPEWRLVDAMATLRMTPPPHLGEAGNIIDGFHRRFSRGPAHMWISDPQQGMPQSIILNWAEAQTVDEICLTFDNLTAFRHDQPWENGTRVLPYLVKAYTVDTWQDGAWHELVRETCNYHRFRRHQFSSVSTNKVRLHVIETHGEHEAARVYQIQVMGKRS